MDLLKIGTQILMSKMNLNVGEGAVQSALGSLLGGGSGGGIDIAGLMSKMQGGGMASMLGSFLGDGDNDTMTESNVMDMLGGDKVEQFASQIGASKDEAANGLSNMLPELINKASSGGKLLEGLGGAGGLLGAAKSLF